MLWLLRRLKAWWEVRRSRRLKELLAVEYDNEEVRVRVLERMEPEWNQTFRWADITRICIKDEGLMASDNVFVLLRDREQAAVVPMEARGGAAFFAALCERGLFPEKAWRKAIGDTSGGTQCWPPYEK